MDVNVLIEPKVDLERLSKVLDEMGHPGRVHTTRTWHRKQMGLLWEKELPENWEEREIRKHRIQ